MAQQRALIIGGSVGGLFAAHLLRSIGWEVAVFERSAEDLADRGAGLGTHGALYAVMRRIGLPLDESMAVVTRSYMCLDRSGHVIRDLSLVRLMSAWVRFYRPLKDALPVHCYHAGRQLEQVDQDGDGVTAIFTDGSRARGDLLVGADGVRSTVRRCRRATTTRASAPSPTTSYGIDRRIRHRSLRSSPTPTGGGTTAPSRRRSFARRYWPTRKPVPARCSRRRLPNS